MGGGGMDSALEAKTDRELLLLTVAELGHIKGHLKELTEKVALQNGRLAAVERGQGEKMPERLTALEHWRTGLAVVLGFVSVAWPLLLYEVRQFLLDKFGFIP